MPAAGAAVVRRCPRSRSHTQNEFVVTASLLIADRMHFLLLFCTLARHTHAHTRAHGAAAVVMRCHAACAVFLFLSIFSLCFSAPLRASFLLHFFFHNSSCLFFPLVNFSRVTTHMRTFVFHGK